MEAAKAMKGSQKARNVFDMYVKQAVIIAKTHNDFPNHGYFETKIVHSAE